MSDERYDACGDACPVPLAMAATPRFVCQQERGHAGKLLNEEHSCYVKFAGQLIYVSWTGEQ